ncbi:MAG: GxxExxY protein [Patescibacteria group bacterium]
METNIRKNTKTTSPSVLYPELSYDLVGIFFDVHKELGLYGREKQYADAIELKLKLRNIPYERELAISDSGNILDFLVDRKIILELKSKRMLTPDDFRQTQHYLQETQMRLGLLVNFREKNIKPVRIVRIDTVKKLQYKNEKESQ